MMQEWINWQLFENAGYLLAGSLDGGALDSSVGGGACATCGLQPCEWRELSAFEECAYLRSWDLPWVRLPAPLCIC